jgi:CheY-like chemotaxis protein
VGRGSTFSFTAQFGRQANPPAAAAAASPHRLRGLRVLVVDDNGTNRQVIERWLSGWGMDATAVGDGTAATDALWQAVAAGRPYGLLLIDARMPDDAGLDVATQIRTRAELAGTRVVLLAAGDGQADGERFRKLRVDAHLLKPLQQHELLETIVAVTSRPAGDWPETDLPEAPAVAASVTSPVPPTAAPAGRRILVAEDSEFNAQLLEKLLVKRGHSVRLVRTGREALAWANVVDFDLMLLDVHMPELDGFDVIRGLRERERATGGHLPVIALTARSRKEDRERCLAAGMDDFLAKPIQTHQFWATIDRVADHRAAAVTGRPGTALVDSRAVLAACGGDDDVLRSIRDALRAQLPVDVEVVRRALQDRDASRLREAAHRLAGMVAAFSTKMGAIASDVEDLAARGRIDDAVAPVAQLYTMAGELLRSIEGLSIDRLRHDAGA